MATHFFPPQRIFSEEQAALDEVLVVEFYRECFSAEPGGEFVRRFAARVKRRLAAAGWVIVPREPTEAMQEAGAEASRHGNMWHIWTAMTAAATRVSQK